VPLPGEWAKLEPVMLHRNPPVTGQLALTFQPEKRIFRVSDLNAELQRVLESDFRGIFVAGEISGCRMASSGHFYFSLKDEKSQVKAVLFKGSARYLKFKPQDGLAVIARGNLEVYEARGEYQLIVESLEPQGAGALQLAFDQLKAKLAAEGLFEAARKRSLPKFPSRIGVVTSPSGAVIRDILHVLERRFPGLQIRLFPAQVQGEGAMAQVCDGLAYFSGNGWAEVVIVARGGGSLEDLWTFNEESVARAVAASTIPVISAIGHETDFTICDFVADCRAPTPSAAAEIVICTRESLIDQISASRARALQALRYRLLSLLRTLNEKGSDRAASIVHRSISRRSQRVDDLEYRLRHLQRDLVESRAKRLAELTRRLEATDLRLRFASIRHRNELQKGQLANLIGSRLWSIRRRLESLSLHLAQLSPLTVLSRGYAIVESPDGKVLREAKETAAGQQVRIRLHRGALDATVNAVRSDAS
jgi:exodeoxyribonuclease VII large subunit